MPKMVGFSAGTMVSFRKAAKDISKAANALSVNVGIALRVIAEEIMTDVKKSTPGHGVPVKTGNLRSTGRVSGPHGKKNPYVSLSFGGSAAPYALIQHEVLRFHHKLGEARYLVRGLERWKPTTSPGYRLMQKNAEANLGGKPAVTGSAPEPPDTSGSPAKSKSGAPKPIAPKKKGKK